jgi:transmembrane sensor
MLEKEIIDKFFQGKATKAEVELIAEYIYSDDADKDLQVILADEFARNGSSELFDPQHNFDRIASKIRKYNNKESQKQHFLSMDFYKAAAVITLLIGFSLVFIIPDQKQTGIENIIDTQHTIIKSTEKGQKLQIGLPDGSRVILNSASSIEYPEFFENDFRTVKISGEAFFEVQNDSLRPFEVFFGENKVRVLGTSFNINYRERENATIALTEGKVRVENTRGVDEIMYPGEMIRISGTSYRKENFDYQSLIGWKDGWLSFDKENFQQIKDKLEMWYGVELEVVGSPDGLYHYSGRYRNKSLKEILDGISYVMKFDYQLKNDKVKILF